MKKKYGFTLIELLAVIVILAIIAVIAIPIILGVIDKAKLGAAKESSTGYVVAMEEAIVLDIVHQKKTYFNTECQLDDINKKKLTCSNSQILNLTVKGTLMDSFRAVVNEKGYVSEAVWRQGNFCGEYSSKTGSTAYKCDEFKISADKVQFTPAAKDDPDVDPNWGNVQNVEQALDYLYGE